MIKKSCLKCGDETLQLPNGKCSGCGKEYKNEDKDFKNYIEKYNDLNFSLIPNKPKSKHPDFRKGGYEPYYYEKCNVKISSHQNVGVMLGEPSGGLIGFDDDTYAESFLDLFPKYRELTLGTKSGKKGGTTFFRMDKLPPNAKITKNGKTIELFTHKRQIILPPSIHPDTGKQYEIAYDHDVLHISQSEFDEIITTLKENDWTVSFTQKNEDGVINARKKTNELLNEDWEEGTRYDNGRDLSLRRFQSGWSYEKVREEAYHINHGLTNSKNLGEVDNWIKAGYDIFQKNKSNPDNGYFEEKSNPEIEMKSKLKSPWNIIKDSKSTEEDKTIAKKTINEIQKEYGVEETVWDDAPKSEGLIKHYYDLINNTKFRFDEKTVKFEMKRYAVETGEEDKLAEVLEQLEDEKLAKKMKPSDYCAYLFLQDVIMENILQIVEQYNVETNTNFKGNNYDKREYLEKSVQSIVEHGFRRAKKEGYGKENEDEKIPQTMQVKQVVDSIVIESAISEKETDQVIVKIDIDGKENWVSVTSAIFTQKVRVEVENEFGNIFSPQTYRTAIENYRAKVLLSGNDTKKVYQRSAMENGAIYYNPKYTDNSIIKITQNIVETISNENAPIFLKTGRDSVSIQPKYLITERDTLQELVELIRIPEEEQILFKVHLISWFLHGFPLPIFLLNGEHGSAKTSTAFVIKSLVDPEVQSAVTFSKSNDDVAINCSKHEVSSFDNITYVNGEQSDFICSMVTGVSYPKRQLYTDADQFVINLLEKIIFNGIQPNMNRSDLLDRIIQYSLPTMPNDERITLKKFHAELNKMKPELLGQIFTILSKAMVIVDEIEIELTKKHKIQRLSDFCVWGEAIARKLGYDEDTFIDEYEKKIKFTRLSLVDSYPIIPLLREMMKDEPSKVMSLDELHKKLVKEYSTGLGSDLTKFEEKLRIDEMTKSTFPKRPADLAKQMITLASSLREMGISASIERYDKRDGKYPRGARIMTIENLEKIDAYAC